MEQIASNLTIENRRNNFINRKMIFNVLGLLLCIEAGMFLICAGVSLYHNEQDAIFFLYSILINAGAAFLFLLFGRGANRQLGRRDGYIIVSASWLLFSVFGMLPFLFSKSIDGVTNAFFETMSGFTTTGATILDDIESLSHGMLFWRSLTQWIGGLGIVLFTIAILPIFGVGNMQLVSAESTGVKHDKIHPKIGMMAKVLWGVYLVLTITEVILLYCGGMSMFDAICHSFTTTATGGYSTKQNSIVHWNSPYIEYVVAIFMLLSSINFSLYFMCVKKRSLRILKDDEVKWFLSVVFAVTIIITTSLMVTDKMDLEKAFRLAFFQVVTCQTSCGFATADYMLWPPFTWTLLLFVMTAGGCTGSTCGGVKSMRVMIMARNIQNSMKRLLHPNAVIPVRVNGQVISSSLVSGVTTFFAVYIAIVLVGWVLLMTVGVDFMEAISVVISSLGNVGPALGIYGPAYSWNALPDAAKWIASFLMLIGRLEIYAVLLMCFPDFWRKQ